MSGFYEGKHDLTGLSMDELQRIGAALHLLWVSDSDMGNTAECQRTVDLMTTIEQQHPGAVGILPRTWKEDV